MSHRRRKLCFAVCISLLWIGLGSCQRVIKLDETTPEPFTEEVRQLAPKAVIDSLTKYGMPIYPGTTPTTIEGIYFCQPNVIISSSLAYDQDSLNRKLYNPYKYRFYEYDSRKLTVKLDYKNFVDDAGTKPGGDIGGGINGYLSGSGSRFTLFVEVNATSNQVKNGRTLWATYKALDTYSGEVTTLGIKNFHHAFYFKEKSDPDNILVPVGTIRVFKDQDKFSEKVYTFRRAIMDSVPNNPRPSIAESR